MKVQGDQTFDLLISNYTQKKEVRSAEQNGAKTQRSLSYVPDMAEKDKAFAMSEKQKSEVDLTAQELPDTIFVKGQQKMKTSRKSGTFC